MKNAAVLHAGKKKKRTVKEIEPFSFYICIYTEINSKFLGFCNRGNLFLGNKQIARAEVRRDERIGFWNEANHSSEMASENSNGGLQEAKRFCLAQVQCCRRHT